MRRKAIIVTLAVILLFLGHVLEVWAIAAPTGLTPDGSEEVPFGGLELDWNDVAAADHYELYYKLQTATNWNDNYPSVSGFSMPALQPGKDYQWYVVSCGNEECSDSASSLVHAFHTQGAGAPPPGPPPPPGTPPPAGPPAEIKNPISSQSFPELLGNALNFLFGLAIVLLPLVIIYGGILLLGSGGDPAKVSRGKTILLWAVIAFAIILLARGLPPVLRGLL